MSGALQEVFPHVPKQDIVHVEMRFTGTVPKEHSLRRELSNKQACSGRGGRRHLLAAVG